MTQRTYDPGLCVGCPECRTPPRYCKMCRVVLTTCDRCGAETDGEDICEKCTEEYEDETEDNIDKEYVT